MTVEERLERLEAIVAQLENEQTDLATALALFEEGVTCLREAATSLTEAETKVKRLARLADGAFTLEDLDDDA
ncbi:MAG: exodeoxyribonuclease VII small subunit [Gemmatimonadaceae bacterium]